MRLILFCGWIRVKADSILWLTRIPGAEYELQLILSCSWLEFRLLDKSCSWLEFRRLDRSCGWFYPAADSIIQLTRVPAAGYELRLILSCGWLEFWWLDRSCGWFYHTADLSSSGWIGVVVNSITRLTRVSAAEHELRLILSCGWFKIRQMDSTCGWLILLIYLVNLRTYSAKCIIFIVCFLPADFSYRWFRLWPLLQEPWRSLRKPEEASRLKLQLILVAAADSRPATNLLPPEFWVQSLLILESS